MPVVLESLGVHDELGTRRKRNVVDAGVGAVLPQHEVAVLVVAEIEDPALDSAGAIRVQPVVVILVQVVEAVGRAGGLQFDHAAPADVVA